MLIMMLNIFLWTTNLISLYCSICCECLLHVLIDNKVDADWCYSPRFRLSVVLCSQLQALQFVNNKRVSLAPCDSHMMSQTLSTQQMVSRSTGHLINLRKYFVDCVNKVVSSKPFSFCFNKQHVLSLCSISYHILTTITIIIYVFYIIQLGP